ncbi:hypothetical protein R1sor_010223 [Riccia sorocarpa]|uniref:CCHC-type domain-containing protein n=1 Tax=Riccia sorocarpa TaxID=122646 RepID=A0ABD3I114_9MARC
MVYNRTRESLDKTRGDDFRSPLKKKSKSPEEVDEAKMATTANFGGGTASKDNVGGATNNGIGNLIFSNPCFKQDGNISPQPTPSTGFLFSSPARGNSSGAEHEGYLDDFPPLCKTVETVTPDPVEDKREEAGQKDPTPSWKAVTQKSLLERHPGWANAHKAFNEPNPYVRGLKADEGTSVTSNELKEVVQDVNSHVNISEYSIGDTIQVDRGFFASRLRHLQNCAFVLCALDAAPSKDRIIEWAREDLWQNRGIQVEQIRILARGCYLIVTGSADQQHTALMDGPYKLNGRMVFAFPWDPKFSPRELRTKLVPVWVDLPKVHPLLEPYGASMLATLGKVLYKTCEAGRDSHIHIRGCVLTDISRKLKDHVKVKLEEVEQPMIQPVWYTSLPNVCFACHQRGHIAKDCPANRAEEQPVSSEETAAENQAEAVNGESSSPATEADNKEIPGNDGFVEVVPRRKNLVPKVVTTTSTGGEAALTSEQEDEATDGDEEMSEDDILDAETSSSPAALDNGQKVPSKDAGDGKKTGNQSNAGSKSAGYPGDAFATINKPGQKTTGSKQAAKTKSTDDGSDTNGRSEKLGGRSQGSLDRLRIARNWLRREHRDAKILALQELKALEESLSFNLNQIWEHSKVVVDYSESGRGGAALILHSSLKVLDCGLKGDGTCAWARIETEAGPVNVMSIYAPNTGRERRALWAWLNYKLTGDNWILAGDMNSVELPDDTDGPSALLNGSELRIWKTITSEFELVLPFQWRIAHVHKVKHEASQVISDHWPVSVVLTLKEKAQEQIRRGTYFKMDSGELKCPETLEEVKQAWDAHPEGVTNPQARWTLSWSRVRSVLSAKKKLRLSFNSPLSKDREELLALRMIAQNDCTTATRERILTLEKAIKQRELADAKSWRTRSRVRWMAEGEAPSHYYFAQLKAKHAREKIRCIRMADGSETSNECEIKTEVTRYFVEQFCCPPASQADLELRKEVLLLVDKRVSTDQNSMLIVAPSEKEIDQLVEDLPRDKAPGLDGVTNNMIQDSWSFIRNDCQKMMLHFWETGELLQKDSQGVIKMLPKNEETWFLRNWRPITLMGITYKLLGKLLANRLKTIVGDLTSPQQTGFIKGRSIFDNLLGSRFGAEWVQESQQEALFLKLDFSKAYDRVRHDFMWETFEAMNIHSNFIRLLKGLVQDGSSKAHVNGWFTEGIPLERGVRQGCPVAPYLFVLSTQPLMLLFEKAQREKRLEGIHLPGGRQLLHQLFADDTGVHLQVRERDFQVTKSIVDTFEKISGAQLNISKSMIIPLGNRDPPAWVLQTGCQVAEVGELVVYLGGPIGRNLSDSQIVDFLAAKLQKRLFHWSNKLLTWSGKVTLLKHVLVMIPTYQLMTISLTRNGFHSLEKICRLFLWGVNQEGRPKTSLVNWEVIQKPKLEGGLGIGSFQAQAEVLKLRLITRIMKDEVPEWVELLSATLNKQSNGWRSEGTFPLQEYLILGPQLSSKSTKTTKWLLSGWYKVRQLLRFSHIGATLPVQLALWKVESLMRFAISPPPVDWKKLRALFRQCELACVNDLVDSTGRRRILPGVDRLIAEDEATKRSLLNLVSWMKETSLGAFPLAQSTGWRWKDNLIPWKHWCASNQGWKRLLSPPPSFDDCLVRNWQDSGDERTWEARWKTLWSGNHTERNKVWLWRIFRNVFFTGGRGKRMGVCDGVCQRCEEDEETIPHLFWSCRKVASRWRQLLQLGVLDGGTYNQMSLLQILDAALQKQKSNPAWFLLVISQTRACWKERNDWYFRRKDTSIPTREIVRETLNELEALGERRKAEDDRRIIRASIHNISSRIPPGPQADAPHDPDSATHWSLIDGTAAVSELGS